MFSRLGCDLDFNLTTKICDKTLLLDNDDSQTSKGQKNFNMFLRKVLSQFPKVMSTKMMATKIKITCNNDSNNGRKVAIEKIFQSFKAYE